VWGGAAQVGVDYYLSPTSFLDLNYTFALSASYKTKYSSPFTNSNGVLTSVGTAYINASQQLPLNRSGSRSITSCGHPRIKAELPGRGP
jgi:hypothetical protein